MSADDQIKNYQDLLRQYNILNQISRTVSSTLDLNKILRIILTGVTFGDGFGFNRAFLFLIDREEKNLIGRMAIGPSSNKEAWMVWGEIQQSSFSLEEYLNSEKFDNQNRASALDDEIKKMRIPLIKGKELFLCMEDGTPRNVNLETGSNVWDDTLQITDPSRIEPGLLGYLDYPKFCIIPLISRTKKVGTLIVDNKFNHREITKADIDFLSMLGQFAASSIRNTLIYNDLKDSLEALAKLNSKLEFLKEYNEKIIESIPVSIIVLDHDFKVTLCNSNSEKLMGRTKEYLIGKKIKKGLVSLDEQDLYDEAERVMQDKRAEGFYKTTVTFGGKKSNEIYDIMLVPFKFSAETPEGVVVIIENMTKTVKLEQSLSEAKRLSELGRLSATVAHEIRNPLIAIGGYVNRVKKKYTETGQVNEENLNIIINEVARLEKIVNEILDYAAERRVEHSEINIGKVLQEVISLAQAAAEQKNVDIVIECGSDSISTREIIMNGNADNLKQAFLNVFNNAIEASETRDQVKICVQLEEDEDGKYITVRVNNRTLLSSEEEVYNIFLPFYTTKSRGSGLGLTITKRIIEQHSGKIDVVSNIDIGTTFTIKLPLVRF
jgi:PAS domain S-box-containing protein